MKKTQLLSFLSIFLLITNITALDNKKEESLDSEELEAIETHFEDMLFPWKREGRKIDVTNNSGQTLFISPSSVKIYESLFIDVRDEKLFGIEQTRRVSISKKGVLYCALIKDPSSSSDISAFCEVDIQSRRAIKLEEGQKVLIVDPFPTDK